MKIRPIFVFAVFIMIEISISAQTKLSPLVGQVAQQLPPGTGFTVLLENSGADAFQVGTKDGVQSVSMPAGSAVPFAYGRQVKVARAMVPAWSALALSAIIKNPIPRGHVLLVSFWTRAPDMKGGRSGSLNVYFEKAAAPYENIARAAANPSGQWQQVFLSVALPDRLPPEGLHLSIHMGMQEQTIELGGLVVLDLGDAVNLASLPHNQITWQGMEADAAWRAEAAKRIAALRLGILNIHVVDAGGKPVPQAEIRVRQIQRDFSFGSFTGHGKEILAPGPEGDRYRAFYTRLFDRATVPVYWADWGWLRYKNQYQALARWAGNQGLALRAHVLIYPGRQYMPAFTKSMNKDQLQKACLAQIDEVAATLKGVPLREIDVTNELRDLTEISQLVGREGVAEWFRRAHADFPGVKLALNENTILTDGGNTGANQDIFLDWYRYLKSQGVAPDVLGMQGHFGESLTGPETVWKILDRFASETDAEIQITEFDVNTNNEEAKAAYTRDFMTACLAHPRVTAFTMWGFWEGDHWIPQAASWNKDWTPRPAGLAIEELLGKTWRSDLTLTSGAEGQCQTPVWLGKLEVSVGKGNKTATQVIDLHGGGTQQTIVVRLK